MILNMLEEKMTLEHVGPLLKNSTANSLVLKQKVVWQLPVGDTPGHLLQVRLLLPHYRRASGSG